MLANLDGCIKEKESLSTHCLQLENKIEAFKAKQSVITLLSFQVCAYTRRICYARTTFYAQVSAYNRG